MLHNQTQLPKSFIKSLNELARAREKAAKQKYLLDIGESLLMHLCSFVLGEYKNSGKPNINLEKGFIRNNKNLSMGIYLGWLRESVKLLNTEKTPSALNDWMLKDHALPQISLFIRQFESLKGKIEEQAEINLNDWVKQVPADNLGKTNLLKFFDVFIILRNRVAHPHKEVKGKMISWPFTEDYFDAINPSLELALGDCFQALESVWQYKSFIYNKEEGVHQLIGEDDHLKTELSASIDFEHGTRILMNDQKSILLADWKQLLKASQAAIDAIKKEEDDARKMQSVDELKTAIRAALDDEQISLEEMKFFESLGRTKFDMETAEIKNIILSVAKEMNIEDPFPAVDKRFLDSIDQALQNKTYNEFILKLMGQQYGVSGEEFIKLVNDRASVLNIDLQDVIDHAVIQFTPEEFTAISNLLMGWMWIRSIRVLNTGGGASNYKITGNANVFNTKEFWHRHAFQSTEKFVASRLKDLQVEGGLEWKTDQNQWQIGAMTGYTWCVIAPKQAPTKAVLALHISLYSEGAAAIGFLPDWKDYKQIENFGLLKSVTQKGLAKYIHDFKSDFEKYPDLLIWDRLNHIAYAPLLETISDHPWTFEFEYALEQIQFWIPGDKIIQNPIVLKEYFDIIFNLFNALITDLIKDYENYLSYPNPMAAHEKELFSFVESMITLTDQYRSLSKKEKRDIRGDLKIGSITQAIEAKEDKYNLQFSTGFHTNIPANKLWYQISFICAGHTHAAHHQSIDQLLSQLAISCSDLGTIYYKKSRFYLQVQLNPEGPIEYEKLHQITDTFLKRLTHLLAQEGIQTLDFRPYNAQFESQSTALSEAMDQLIPLLTPLFSNRIIKERKLVKKFRYVDFVSSNKYYGNHWIGWGAEITADTANLVLTYFVRDINRGEKLVAVLDELISGNSEWNKKLIQTLPNRSNANWVMKSGELPDIKSSSIKSNKHDERQLPSNSKSSWSTAVSNVDQWLEIDFGIEKILWSLQLQKSHCGTEWITQFELMTSADGQEWKSISNVEVDFEEAADQFEFVPDEPVYMRYLKIKPLQWEQHISARMDFLVSDLPGMSMEVSMLQPMQSPEQITGFFQALPEKISTWKDQFPKGAYTFK